MMINLKDETLTVLNGIGKEVKYCHIYVEDGWGNLDDEICKGQLNINLLDFKYDNGYGGQEIYGFIVFTDDTWISREEYDGSEWWQYFETPKLND